jgi:hypothetical protein
LSGKSGYFQPRPAPGFCIGETAIRAIAIRRRMIAVDDRAVGPVDLHIIGAIAVTVATITATISYIYITFFKYNPRRASV